MPKSDTPRKMNGATLPGRSMPPASPQAAMAPPYLVIDSALANVVDPTESMPPAQDGGKIAGERGVFGVEFDSLSRCNFGLVHPIEFGQQHRPVGSRQAVARIELHRAGEGLLGRLELVLLVQRRAEIDIGHRQSGLQLDGLAVAFDRFIEAVLMLERAAELVERYLGSRE